MFTRLLPPSRDQSTDYSFFIEIEYFKEIGNEYHQTTKINLSQKQSEETIESFRQTLKQKLGIQLKNILLSTGIESEASEQSLTEIDDIILLKRVNTCIEIFTQFKESFLKLNSIEIINYSTHNILIQPILEWICSLQSLNSLKIESITPFSIELFNSLQKAVLSQENTIKTVILHLQLAQQLTRKINEPQSKEIQSLKNLNLLSDLHLLEYLDNFTEIMELDILITDEQTDRTLKAVKKYEKKLRKLTLNYKNSLNNSISNEDFKQLSKFLNLQNLKIKCNFLFEKSNQLFDLPPFLSSLSLTLHSPVEFLNASTKILPSLTSLQVSSYLSTNHLPLNFELFPNLTSLSLSYHPQTQRKILEIIQTDFINMRKIVQKLEYLSFNINFRPAKINYFWTATIYCISDILSRTSNSCTINIGIDPFILNMFSILKLASSLVHLNNVENQLTIHNYAFKDLEKIFKSQRSIQILESDLSFFLCLLAKKSQWFQQKLIVINLTWITPEIDLIAIKKLNLKCLFDGIVYLSIFFNKSLFIKLNMESEHSIFESVGILQNPDEIKSISFYQSIPSNFLKESVTGWKSLRKIKFYNLNEIQKQPEFLDQLEKFLTGCKSLSGPKFCLEIVLGRSLQNINDIIMHLFSMENNFLRITCQGGNYYSHEYITIFQIILNSNFRFTGHFLINIYKISEIINLKIAKAINEYSKEIEFLQLEIIAFESAYKLLLPVHPVSVFVDLRFD